ncbi:MAG: hypothetical protein PV344_00455 [Anaplasma sp.]|uniref:hypothetical protein n=1 Tax=Anaplasma phagocytophilum TaxID=948 RepID=UPI00201AA1D1|nr:hypothetical protein [Anaplasma sp.]
MHGLVGILGVMFVKAVSYATKKTIIAVNHLVAHALVEQMIQEIVFSCSYCFGCHCQFMLAHDVGCYSKLGVAFDDSLGEAFDK